MNHYKPIVHRGPGTQLFAASCLFHIAQACLIAVPLASSFAQGQSVPALMNYQGKLTDVAGNPMANGSYDLLFRVWRKADPADPADALVWGQTNTVTIVNGIFNVILGGSSGIVANASRTNLTDAFDEPQRYLSLMILRNPAGPVSSPLEILPRAQMLSAPYALRTSVADNAVNAYNGVPPGSILPFGGGNVPAGFLLCDGTPVSRTAYPNLFAAIGTAWGSGDGYNNFNLPDLRGYFLRGRDASANRDPTKDSRTASASGGNAGNLVGSVQQDELKAHSMHYSYAGIATPSRNDSTGIDVLLHGKSALGGPNAASDGKGAAGNRYSQDDNQGAIYYNSSDDTHPKNAYVNYLIKY